MSGSGARFGTTIVGSSPGRQRSIFSGAPSDEPKNRLDVLKEKLSRGTAVAIAWEGCDAGAAFSRPSDGLASSDIDPSNCASGGALRAACSSGSSGAASADGARSTVLAPFTNALEVAGSSDAGVFSAGSAASLGCGGVATSRSPFAVRSTLGKSAA